jgi:hypothetical protein
MADEIERVRLAPPTKRPPTEAAHDQVPLVRSTKRDYGAGERAGFDGKQGEPKPNNRASFWQLDDSCLTSLNRTVRADR